MPWGDDWTQTSTTLSTLLNAYGGKHRFEHDDFIPFREGTSLERRRRRQYEEYKRVRAEEERLKAEREKKQKDDS